MFGGLYEEAYARLVYNKVLASEAHHREAGRGDLAQDGVRRAERPGSDLRAEERTASRGRPYSSPHNSPFNVRADKAG